MPACRQTGLINPPYTLFNCSQILRGCLFASYVHRTIKEGGSVKAFGRKSGGSAT